MILGGCFRLSRAIRIWITLKSCIDHIISNIPSKLTHITTTDKGYSDHSILTATYHTKTPLTRQKLIKTRPSYLLTTHLLNSYIDCNDILQTIFNYTCLNLIANILMTELNAIINIIAPSKIIQVRNDYTPYMTDDLQQRQTDNLQLLKTAKRTGQTSDWTEYRNKKHYLTKTYL